MTARKRTKADHRVRVAEEKRVRMRAHLIDTAIRLLAEEGPAAISIDSIVDAAEVARGTFYNYFSTPTELMQVVGTELSEDLISTVNQVVRQHDDPAERASVGLRAILACARASPILASVIMQSGWPIVAADHALHRLVGQDIAAGFKSGRFRPMPYDVAMALVGGLAVGVMPSFADGSARPGMDEEVAETMLRGLGLASDQAAKVARIAFNPVDPGSNGLLARLLGGAAIS